MYGKSQSVLTFKVGLFILPRLISTMIACIIIYAIPPGSIKTVNIGQKNPKILIHKKDKYWYNDCQSKRNFYTIQYFVDPPFASITALPLAGMLRTSSARNSEGTESHASLTFERRLSRNLCFPLTRAGYLKSRYSFIQHHTASIGLRSGELGGQAIGVTCRWNIDKKCILLIH